MSEQLLYPLQINIKTVAVFGGANPGSDPRLNIAAAALGSEIGAAGIRLVYGGGSEGLMGAVAAAAANSGGEVIAVAPQFLLERMRMPGGIAQVIAVPDMHIRKRLMFDYADAFVALPGGIGTIEELAEVMTWRKLNRHQKPILMANFLGFWSPWLALLAHLEETGFLCGEVLSACLIAERPAAILPMLQRGVSYAQAPRAACVADDHAHANATPSPMPQFAASSIGHPV
ncbi:MULTISPECIES: TIGR00730 family Rossman fold protein [unclassified Mesorhizobium]|uniref:LOG family protein n=1 Tax=unclassified Mesorhizobium TaxID=325217 RepID=UPI0015E43315|nr:MULTISPECIES: TIGR00730 family Rossman fold protein [unclassified Mesorhizobium]